MVVLVLSESFDNFSIGQILNVRRELYVKTEENRTLRSENEVLRKNIINLSATFFKNQTNSSIVISNGNGMLGGNLPVQLADEHDVRERNKQEENIYKKEKYSVSLEEKRKIEDASLDFFVEKNNLNMASVIKDAKFMKNYIEGDPIANFNHVFDAFVRTKDEEMFVDARYIRHPFSLIVMRDRIYAILSRIYIYKLMSKMNAKLVLIFILDESVDKNDSAKRFDDFKRYFYPAIANGFLNIEIFDKKNINV